MIKYIYSILIYGTLNDLSIYVIIRTYFGTYSYIIYYISQLFVNDYLFVKISTSQIHIFICLGNFGIYVLLYENQPFLSYRNWNVNRNYLNLFIYSKSVLDSCWWNPQKIWNDTVGMTVRWQGLLSFWLFIVSFIYTYSKCGESNHSLV